MQPYPRKEKNQTNISDVDFDPKISVFQLYTFLPVELHLNLLKLIYVFNTFLIFCF